MKLPAITAVLAQYRNTSDGLVTPGMMEAAWAELHDAERLMLDAFDAHMVSSVSRRTFGPMVEARRALAALGLDEPPTEAMLTCGCGAQRAHESARGQVGCPHCRTPFRAVVPPTEPPKACPTCDGYGGQPGLRGLDRLLHPPCAACNGTGIDGGTA